MNIILENYKFNIIHRTNKRIKNISIMLENQTDITVKTPLKTKANQLRDIVLQHKKWILNTIKKVPAKNKFDFICGGVLPFVGIDYPIILTKDEKIKTPKFILKDDIFYISHNSINSYDDFLNGLINFYKIMAKKTINPLFDKWSLETKLVPQKIGYRKAKRRWGSCSYKNNISINYMILQFPKDTIEYVVLHELCHIKEKNHSKRFWNLLSSYMPKYKQQEIILKKNYFN